MADLTAIAHAALAHATSGEELEAYVVHRVSTTIQADGLGGIRSLEHAEVRGLGVRVISDHRLGYASTSDLSDGALAAVVRRARGNAAVTDVDEAQVLPRPSASPAVEGLLDQRWGAASLANKTALVVDVARRVVAADPRIRSIDTCELLDTKSAVAIASTTGVDIAHESGYFDLWCDAIGDDGGTRAADSGHFFARCLEDLDVDRVVAETVERTRHLLGPTAVPTTDAVIVLDPFVTADLLEAVGKAVAGGPMSSGRSPFAHRLGDQVGSRLVTLSDAGRSELSPDGARYDDEGVARQHTTVVRDGELVSSLHSTVTAAAVGGRARSTGNARRASYKSPPRSAPSALALKPTTTLAGLAQRYPEAVYVQQLAGAGSGINAVTGQVEVSSTAWLWRDGAPAGRVVGHALTTDLISWLGSIVDVADDARHIPFTPTIAGTVVCSAAIGVLRS